MSTGPAAPPTLDESAPTPSAWRIGLASGALVFVTLAGAVPVELASTPILVAVAPHTQWLIAPSAMLAHMFTQCEALCAVHAMAWASL